MSTDLGPTGGGEVALEVDLVVVGFGAAGAAAALTAAREGASVVVLEKQAANAHTPSTRMSGGLVMAVNDVAAATDYLDVCAGGMVPRAVSARWAQEAAGIPRWLGELGLDLSRIGGAEHPDLRGAEAIDVYQPGAARHRLDSAAGGGIQLWEALRAAVAASDVDVRWESPGASLMEDAEGRVVGVMTAASGATPSRTYTARHGVVLACGGYEFDEAMKLDHLRASPIYFYGNPGNTGDGVRMAQAVGADLWHMNQMIGRAIGSFLTPEGQRLSFIIKVDPPGYVITDGQGRRFSDESAQARLLHGFYYDLLPFDVETGRYPRIPCYWFFDEKRRTAGPLTYTHIGAAAVGMYDWSPDNSAELDLGWIHRGSTIADAARAAGLADPEAAQEAVDRYNIACAAGVDELGRPADTLVPIVEPPFYCVPLYPGGSNTTGGPRRDEHARVQHVFGGSIPGLFAAGELGQASGMTYPADGCNISEALAFGKVAALAALAERAFVGDGRYVS